MTGVTTPVPATKRSQFSVWLPWVILVLAAAAETYIWFLTPADWERANQFVSSVGVGLVTLLLLAAWLLFFSSFRTWVRLGAVGGVVLLWIAFYLSLREVKFSGDMVPTFVFKWSPTHDDLVEAHRRERSDAGEIAPVEITDLPTDSPEYRNRKRDGVVQGPPLNRDWQTKPPRLVWRQPCGGGYAGFAVAGNLAVTIEQRRDQEAVVGYDTATGAERWVHSYPALFSEKLGGDGPRATPTIAGGDVFSLGATGRLVCLDAATGKEKWAKDILADNENIAWGMSGSPLVYDNVVVVNPGAQTEAAKGRALVAYERTTGKEVWHAGDYPAAYGSPMLASFSDGSDNGGMSRQVLIFDGQGIAGYAANGQGELWRQKWETQQGINVTQPVVLNMPSVFISSGYGVGGAILGVGAWGGPDGLQQKGKWAVWFHWGENGNKKLRCKFSSPVLRQGDLYGLDEGVLVCLDTRTGDRKWKGDRSGRYGHGQLLLADDLLVILSESGELALVEATPDEFRELGRIQALDGKTWNCPALANGKAYVRNHQEMACYDLGGAGR
jgi:outer membrane protein assembly factor BamB